MRRVKTLVAKNPSEARGIRKALRAAGIKFEFKSAGPGGKRRKKRSPKKKARRSRQKRKSRRRSNAAGMTYKDGYRDGATDFRLGHKSSYIWNLTPREPGYEYARGYKAGWNDAARRK